MPSTADADNNVYDDAGKLVCSTDSSEMAARIVAGVGRPDRAEAEAKDNRWAPDWMGLDVKDPELLDALRRRRNLRRMASQGGWSESPIPGLITAELDAEIIRQANRVYGAGKIPGNARAYFPEPFDSILRQHAPDLAWLAHETRPNVLCSECGQVADRECPVLDAAPGRPEYPMGCVPVGLGDPEHPDILRIKQFYRWKARELVPSTRLAAMDQQFHVACNCGWRSSMIETSGPSYETAPEFVGGKLLAIWAHHLLAPT